MLKYHRPKGTRDILPDEARQREELLRRIRPVLAAYGFVPIEIPTFEQTEVFVRSIGEASDIVTKEMYTFEDRGGRSLTLRPEGTAGIVRALLENNLRLPCRLFHVGPIFRQERPQKGRYREFYQLGAEIFGQPAPEVDGELIEMACRFFAAAGIAYGVKLNNIGCPTCRPAFRDRLTAFLRDKEELLCDDCRYRLDRNPLRVFDCKVPSCQLLYADAPHPGETSCDACRDHFDRVRAYVARALPAAGQPGAPEYVTPFPNLVRGIDYYQKTVFEFTSARLGAQDALGGGGRYDDLVADFGGPPTPAVGFALGIERMLLAATGIELSASPVVFVAALGPAEYAQGLAVAHRLREHGITVWVEHAERRLKQQLKHANGLPASHVIIVGEDELTTGRVTLKTMATGAQVSLTIDELIVTLGRA